MQNSYPSWRHLLFLIAARHIDQLWFSFPPTYTNISPTLTIKAAVFLFTQLMASGFGVHGHVWHSPNPSCDFCLPSICSNSIMFLHVSYWGGGRGQIHPTSQIASLFAQVYVTLSRVRTFDGLFICEKLDETKKNHVDPKLLEEEERLRQIEQNLMNFLNR